MTEQITNISFDDLIKITDYDSVSINYLSPFTDASEIEVTLVRNGKREKYYTSISIKEQPQFTEWFLGNVGK